MSVIRVQIRCPFCGRLYRLRLDPLKLEQRGQAKALCGRCGQRFTLTPQMLQSHGDEDPPATPKQTGMYSDIPSVRRRNVPLLRRSRSSPLAGRRSRGVPDAGGQRSLRHSTQPSEGSARVDTVPGPARTNDDSKMTDTATMPSVERSSASQADRGSGRREAARTQTTPLRQPRTLSQPPTGSDAQSPDADVRRGTMPGHGARPRDATVPRTTMVSGDRTWQAPEREQEKEPAEVGAIDRPREEKEQASAPAVEARAELTPTSAQAALRETTLVSGIEPIDAPAPATAAQGSVAVSDIVAPPLVEAGAATPIEKSTVDEQGGDEIDVDVDFEDDGASTLIRTSAQREEDDHDDGVATRVGRPRSPEEVGEAPVSASPGSQPIEEAPTSAAPDREDIEEALEDIPAQSDPAEESKEAVTPEEDQVPKAVLVDRARPPEDAELAPKPPTAPASTARSAPEPPASRPAPERLPPPHKLPPPTAPPRSRPASDREPGQSGVPPSSKPEPVPPSAATPSSIPPPNKPEQVTEPVQASPPAPSSIPPSSIPPPSIPPPSIPPPSVRPPSLPPPSIPPLSSVSPPPRTVPRLITAQAWIAMADPGLDELCTGLSDGADALLDLLDLLEARPQ